jgi:hypothetical protein
VKNKNKNPNLRNFFSFSFRSCFELTVFSIVSNMAAVEQAQFQQEEEEEASFEEVDKLTTVGVNVGDVKKLKEAGFHTVASVLMATSKVGST